MVVTDPRERWSDNKFSARGWIGIFLGGSNSTGYKIFRPTTRIITLESEVRTFRDGKLIGYNPSVMQPDVSGMLKLEEQESLQAKDEGNGRGNSSSFPASDAAESQNVQGKVARVAQVRAALPFPLMRAQNMESLPVEPESWLQASKTPEVREWRDVIDEEMEAHLRNNTFEVSTFHEVLNTNAKIV